MEAVASSPTQSRYVTPLIVRKQTRPVLVVLSTHTWAAYNSFGGLSNYLHEAIPLPLFWIFRIAVSFNVRIALSDAKSLATIPLPSRRPLDILQADLLGPAGQHPSHLHRAERIVIDELKTHGFPISIATQEEFDRHAVDLRNVRLAVFCAHSEYWSQEGIGLLRSFCDQPGTSVLFLSGNNIYRQVDMTANGLEVVNQRISQTISGKIIGASYSARGYLTYSGYEVKAPDHWLFEGTGATSMNTLIGDQCQQPGAYPASGLETDRIHADSDPSFSPVAIGANPEGPAYFVCKDKQGGAFVANTASVAFSSSISGNPVLGIIVANSVRRALNSPVECPHSLGQDTC